MDILSFVVVGLLAVLGVSALVEFYKKTIRKDKAKTWEIRVAAAVLSIGASTLMCLSGLAYLFFPNVIINIAIYAVVIFLLQLFLDMKVIKKILNSALEYLDLDKFITTVLGKLGITKDKILKILETLNITEDKLREALKEAGVSDDVIEKIVKILYESN